MFVVVVLWGFFCFCFCVCFVGGGGGAAAFGKGYPRTPIRNCMRSLHPIATLGLDNKKLLSSQFMYMSLTVNPNII